MRSLFTSILLITGSVLVSLLVVEGMVRLFFPQNRLVTWIEMHDRGFMQNQPGGEFFQERGGRRVEYILDKAGLRGDFPVDGSADIKKEVQVLVLGDSFTFGLLLNASDTFLNRWEEMLRMDAPVLTETGDINPKINRTEAAREQDHFRLLNAGVGGAGLADWPLWLEEHGSGLKPDIVIYVLNTADVERTLSKNLFLLDEELGTLTQTQRWRPRPFFRWLGRTTLYRGIQAHSEFVNRITTYLWKTAYFEDLTDNFQAGSSQVPFPEERQFSPESGYSTRLSLSLLNRMDRWCKRENCDFIVTTTGFFEDHETGAHTRRLYETLLQTETAYPFYDITPCLAGQLSQTEHPDVYFPFRIPGDSHPNEHGARLMARCFYHEVPLVVTAKP